ncbi:hypothetical protein CF319_g6041 [Tilletia indica]|nr:hypothetical protein CF319_g6041 [Tilletia indica]
MLVGREFRAKVPQHHLAQGNAHDGQVHVVDCCMLYLLLLAIALPIVLLQFFSTHNRSDNMASSTALLKSIIIPPGSGKAATATVIFSHGLGDSGAGWADVAQMLSARPKLRNVRFVLPHAPSQPVTLNAGYRMPSWFDIYSLDNINGTEDEKGLLESKDRISKLIENEISNGVPANRIVVGGFSQGGAVSYLTGLLYPTPLAGIVALSTWLPIRDYISKALQESGSTPPANPPPIFHGHGNADPVVQYEFGKRTIDFLKTPKDKGGLGFSEDKIRFETYPGMPHSACPQEIEHIGEFLDKVIGDA